MIPLSKNPPARFPQEPIKPTQDIWWVAKVKPRQEKALAFDLIDLNIEYYLPMYTKQTRRKDNNKLRKTILCLFPGYLSYRIPKGYHREIYSTNRIVNLVEVKNQKHFIKQLDQVYRSLDLGIPLEPLDYVYLTEGKLVRVNSGPMRGVEGTISKVQSGYKLILSVDVLGKASVTIDASQVESI